MRKTANGDAGRLAMRVICIFMLLLLLAFILLTEARRSSEAVGRESADKVTYARTDALEGYVFRDEVTVPSSNNGPIEYLVEDGSAVLAGQELAKVYTGSQGGTVQRDEAAPIYAEIERLEKALEEEMIAWQLSYADSYGELMKATGSGKWQTGIDRAAELADTLEKRSVLKGDGEAVRIRLATLRAKAAELVRYEDDPHVPVALETGYFSKSTDGYEALFGTSAVAGLTPKGLERLLQSASADAGVAVHNIGKLVSAGEFYLAVPVPMKTAEGYTEGNDYRVRMSRASAATMRLVRIATSEGSDEALLILYAERHPAGMDLSRRQSVVIEREYIKGLSVSARAVFGEGDENFVYVVKNGIAEKRRVRVLCEENGCCIVAADVGEGYLAAGENVLVTWRSVYEGKELNR